MTSTSLLAIVLFGGIGLALGLVHFHGLRGDARRYLVRGVRVGAVVVHLARLVVSVAVLVFIARAGALPLLAALAGFLVARFVAVAQAPRLV